MEHDRWSRWKVESGENLKTMKHPYLLIITGHSCSGKSTLIKELQKNLTGSYHIGYDKIKWWIAGYDRDRDVELVKNLLEDSSESSSRRESAVSLMRIWRLRKSIVLWVIRQKPMAIESSRSSWIVLKMSVSSDSENEWRDQKQKTSPSVSQMNRSFSKIWRSLSTFLKMPRCSIPQKHAVWKLLRWLFTH